MTAPPNPVLQTYRAGLIGPRELASAPRLATQGYNARKIAQEVYAHTGRRPTLAELVDARAEVFGGMTVAEATAAQRARSYSRARTASPLPPLNKERLHP